MHLSDTLSRQLPVESNETSTIAFGEMSPFVESIVGSLPVSDVKLQQIIAAQAEDPVCTKIKEYIMEGWPDKYKIS